MIPSGFFEAILTRPTLKQIEFWISNSDLGFEIEQKFIKNSMVEEITFRFSPPFSDFKKIKTLSDALPNIKTVRVLNTRPYIENLPAILKIISDFKKLEFLQAGGRDTSTPGHCAISLEISGEKKLKIWLTRDGFKTSTAKSKIFELEGLLTRRT